MFELVALREIARLLWNYNYYGYHYSTLNKDENYYLRMFLKESKYIEKQVLSYLTDNLPDFYSDDVSLMERKLA